VKPRNKHPQPEIDVARRQPLSHTEGREELYGPPAAARLLSSAFKVRTRDRDLPIQGVHGVHPYPARFHPAWARQLLRDVGPNQVVLDPFCGSGTVLAEASLAGKPSRGADVNAIALRIALLRTTRRDEGFLEHVVRAGQMVHERAQDRERSPYGILAKGEKRFPPHVLTQLINLRDAIDDVRDDEVREVLLLSMTPLLGKFGRKTGRAAPSVGRRAVRDAFLRRVERTVMELAEYANAVPAQLPDPDIRLADAREQPWEPGEIDVVITSPPYPGVYHYAAEQGLAATWLLPAGASEDLLAAARKTELGRRGARPGSWEGAMRWVLRSLGDVVRRGGSMYFVVGDGAEEQHPVFVDDVLGALTQESEVPFRVVAACSQERPHFHGPTSHLFRRRPRREHLVRFERI
jgi:hypothetical protein